MVNINQKLCDNVMKNNTNEVIELINKGANIDAYGGMPLMYSIQSNDYPMTKLLLSMNANINIKEGFLLYLACDKGHYEIVELLLNEGINYTDTYNLLIQLCIQNDDDISLVLLVQHNIVKIIIDQKFYLVEINEWISLFDVCLRNKAKKILQFIIDNYPEITPNHPLLVKQKTVKKYRFIKMLIDRNIIDVAD